MKKIKNFIQRNSIIFGLEIKFALKYLVFNRKSVNIL